MPIAVTLQEFGILVLDENKNLLWEYSVPDHVGRFAGLDFDEKEQCFYIADMVSIKQINLKGEILWEYSNDRMFDLHSLQLLDNGNLLVASTAFDLVLEINKKQGVVWEWYAGDHYKIPKKFQLKKKIKQWLKGIDDHWTHLNHAWRLDDGRTLISLYRQCMCPVVDKEGNVIHEVSVGTDRQHYFVPYKDGYLIGDTGNSRIVQLNSDFTFKSMLSHPLFKDTLAVYPKPNGNFLVADPIARYIFEFNENMEMVWNYHIERAPKIGRSLTYAVKYIEKLDLTFSPEEKKRKELKDI
jgi:hypothetical protein